MELIRLNRSHKNDFKRHIDLSPDEQVFYWKNLERLGHYRGCSPNKKFHYHGNTPIFN